LRSAENKILKKKVLPKKKVVDAAGDEWEVIDKKKTVIVEYDSEEDMSDSD